MPELAAYLAIGAATGFFAGLLGIGGGAIIVSSLALMFAAHGFPAPLRDAHGDRHLARRDHGGRLGELPHPPSPQFRRLAHGAPMIPGLLAGVFAGALIARVVNTAFLKVFFLVFLALIISQMVLNLRPKASRTLPGRAGLTAVALFIGVSSSLFGGGAAAVGVPFLTWCNMTTHRAIGTVSAMGFPLAIAGTVGYAVDRAVGSRASRVERGLRLLAGLHRHLDREPHHRALRRAPRAPLEGPHVAAHLRRLPHRHRREGGDFRLAQALHHRRIRVRKRSTDCSMRPIEHHSSVWCASFGSPGPEDHRGRAAEAALQVRAVGGERDGLRRGAPVERAACTISNTSCTHSLAGSV